MLGPPGSKRTDTLVPYTTLCRAPRRQGHPELASRGPGEVAVAARPGDGDGGRLQHRLPLRAEPCLPCLRPPCPPFAGQALMTMLQGKSGIVTGAAQGFGRATAERLCRAGARVALVDVKADAVMAAARTLADQGFEALGK